MGVKSDKTFEEVAERLAALFRLQSDPSDADVADIHDEIDVRHTGPADSVVKPASGRGAKTKKSSVRV